MSSEQTQEVQRIPMREYIRSQFRAILVFVGMLVILFFIIQLSAEIAPDRSVVNPENIISTDSSSVILLMLLSSTLFLIIFAVFTKVVLLDHKRDFAIRRWDSPRGIVTFILTTSFISLVHILLDIALINIYLITFPVWVVWKLPQLFPIAFFEFIPQTTDKAAYADIRTFFFLAIITLLFIFPVSMLISIFTRYGRRFIKRRRERKIKLPVRRLLFYFVLFPIIGITLANIYNNPSLDPTIGAILIFIMAIVGLSWAVVILLLLAVFIRITAIFTYSNFLLIFPLIFFFYLLPGILWGVWDLAVLASRDPQLATITNDTVYQWYGIPLTSQEADISNLTVTELLLFFGRTVSLNLGHVSRIIQLDFVLVVGIGALIIGFAEGYSLFAIVRSISTGVSIARTGRVATRSAPRIFVLTSRLFYLFAWLGLLWDNLIILAGQISEFLGIDLSFLEFPRVFTFLTDFVIYFTDLGDIQAFIALLVIPLYFIITSSFKFLGVSLVLSRYEEDSQTYTLMISSAFVLIVTHILADIAALEDFQADQGQFLPTKDLAFENLLPFAVTMFDILESVAFYVGFAATLYFGFRRLVSTKDDTKPIPAQESSTNELEYSEQVEQTQSLEDQLDTPDKFSQHDQGPG